MSNVMFLECTFRNIHSHVSPTCLDIIVHVVCVLCVLDLYSNIVQGKHINVMLCVSRWAMR